MREMVFNHASAIALDVEQSVVREWLVDALRGMSELVIREVVDDTLRLESSPYEMECMPGHSLGDVVQSLRQSGYRDEMVFFSRLTTKVPLLHDIRADYVDRFHGCQGRGMPDVDGAPLVLCAISDGVSIGLPSQPVWDDDCIEVEFDELLDDGTLERVFEQVDQLSRSSHAGAICERHLARIPAITNPAELWEERNRLFPNLVFGPGVEGDLQKNARLMGTIIGKLRALDQSAREWRETGGPAPRWRTLVSPESPVRMRDTGFRDARRFRSQRGTIETFEWHARFGGSGRIHIRFDPERRDVEVGYIGPHLPS